MNSKKFSTLYIFAVTSLLLLAFTGLDFVHSSDIRSVQEPELIAAPTLRRQLLQSGQVTDEPQCNYAKCPHKCKRQTTARMMSILGGVYGAGRIYLGHIEVGGLKILASFLGLCIPLCHLYVFGFNPENNREERSFRAKRQTVCQKICRCKCRRVKIPFTRKLLPCWGTTGNPIYGLLFIGFIAFYVHDIMAISSGRLVALAPFENCYLKDFK